MADTIAHDHHNLVVIGASNAAMHTAARAAASDLGVPHARSIAMCFMGLEVIPSLKITDLGLVDVDRFDSVPAVV